jgi:hypothetical protein
MSLPLPARALLFAAACTAALPGAAQPASRNPPAAPSPLDPKASVPAPSYESAFTRFRRWSAETPVSWRQANDTVTGIGGWRVYAREAQQVDAAPAPNPPAPSPAAATTPAAAMATLPLPLPARAPAPADPAQPMPAGHGGHKTP